MARVTCRILAYFGVHLIAFKRTRLESQDSQLLKMQHGPRKGRLREPVLIQDRYDLVYTRKRTALKIWAQHANREGFLIDGKQPVPVPEETFLATSSRKAAPTEFDPRRRMTQKNPGPGALDWKRRTAQATLTRSARGPREKCLDATRQVVPKGQQNNTLHVALGDEPLITVRRPSRATNCPQPVVIPGFRRRKTKVTVQFDGPVGFQKRIPTTQRILQRTLHIYWLPILLPVASIPRIGSSLWRARRVVFLELGPLGDQRAAACLPKGLQRDLAEVPPETAVTS